MKTVCVIGTGIMGSGIVSNFLSHGYTVYIWNRTKEHSTSLLEKGALWAETPAEAAACADIIIDVTANDISSRTIWTGEEGIIPILTKDKICIVCSTLSIQWTEELNTLCKARNAALFDMPMTGGRIAAEQGSLILLAGGDKETLESIRPDLSAISSKIIYFGKAGSGMKYKLILNTLQAIHIAAFGDALRMAQEAGLDVSLVGEALSERPGGVATQLAWRDYQTDPDPINFSVEWIAKDLTYAKDIATTFNASLLEETLSRYKNAIKEGGSNSDWTVINKE